MTQLSFHLHHKEIIKSLDFIAKPEVFQKVKTVLVKNSRIKASGRHQYSH